MDRQDSGPATGLDQEDVEKQNRRKKVLCQRATRPALDDNNNNINKLYSPPREIKAVVRFYTLTIIQSHVGAISTCMMKLIMMIIIVIIIIIKDISGTPFRTSPIGFQKAVIIILYYLKRIGRGGRGGGGGILSKVRMYVLIQLDLLYQLYYTL